MPGVSRRSSPPVTPIIETIVVGADGRYAGDRDSEDDSSDLELTDLMSAVEDDPVEPAEPVVVSRPARPIETTPEKPASRQPRKSRKPMHAATVEDSQVGGVPEDPYQIEDLNAWTASKTYVPDRRYLLLRRLSPHMHVGIRSAGDLERIYEPIDQDYVRETWGGGEYLISYMVAKGDGTPRREASGTFAIPGDPAAYMDSEGRLKRFPEPTPDEREALRPVGRRRSARDLDPLDFDFGGFGSDSNPFAFPRRGGQPHMPGPAFPFSEPPPATPAQSLDVISLARTLQGDPASKAAQETMRDLATQANAERTRALEQLQAIQAQSVEQALAPLRTAIESARQQLDSERAGHAKEIDRLRADYNDRLAQVRSELEGRLQQQAVAFQQQINDVRAERDRSVQQAREMADADVRRHREELDRARQEAQAERERAQRDAQDRVEAARREGQQALDRVRSEMSMSHSAEKAQIIGRAEAAERALEQSRAEAHRREETMQSELRALRESAENRTSRLEESARIQIEKITTAHRDQIEKLEATYRGQIAKLETDHRAQVEKLETAAERREEKLQAELRDQAAQRVDSKEEALTARYAPQVDRLQGEVQRLTRELSEARAEARAAQSEALAAREEGIDRRNPMNQLEEQMATFGRLKALVGGGESGGGSPVPPDDNSFFGKLMRYGPTISDTLLKPVLSTVADVTDVARQESQRRAAFEEQLAQRRAATTARAIPARPVAVPAPVVHAAPQRAPAPLAPSPVGAPIGAREERPTPPISGGSTTAGPIPPVHAARVSEHSIQPQTSSVPTSTAPPASATSPAPPAGEAPEILTLLRDAFNGGQTPQEVGTQLLQGVNMGMVPREMLDEIRRLPAGEVVGQYTQAAEHFGVAELTTPAAERYLRDLYAVLTA